MRIIIETDEQGQPSVTPPPASEAAPAAAISAGEPALIAADGEPSATNGPISAGSPPAWLFDAIKASAPRFRGRREARGWRRRRGCASRALASAYAARRCYNLQAVGRASVPSGRPRELVQLVKRSLLVHPDDGRWTVSDSAIVHRPSSVVSTEITEGTQHKNGSYPL